MLLDYSLTFAYWKEEVNIIFNKFEIIIFGLVHTIVLKGTLFRDAIQIKHEVTACSSVLQITSCVTGTMYKIRQLESDSTKI